MGFSIVVADKVGQIVDMDESPTTEDEARTQAAGWTGQRGQMTWVARIYKDGVRIATYRRGQESDKS